MLSLEGIFSFLYQTILFQDPPCYTLSLVSHDFLVNQILRFGYYRQIYKVNNFLQLYILSN